MNTRGVPDTGNPYTFSFACGDETSDIVPADLIMLDIPITFRAVEIRWGLISQAGTVQIELYKNNVPIKTLDITTRTGKVSGTGFAQGDVLNVVCTSADALNKGLKIYLVGYV